MAWYSGVRGASWRGPGGLLGSHTPTGLPRPHKPSQSGNFLMSSALALTHTHSAEASTAVRIELRKGMHSSCLRPAVILVTGEKSNAIWMGRRGECRDSHRSRHAGCALGGVALSARVKTITCAIVRRGRSSPCGALTLQPGAPHRPAPASRDVHSIGMAGMELYQGKSEETHLWTVRSALRPPSGRRPMRGRS